VTNRIESPTQCRSLPLVPWSHLDLSKQGHHARLVPSLDDLAVGDMEETIAVDVTRRPVAAMPIHSPWGFRRA
jgi:hypothetical protein